MLRSGEASALLVVKLDWLTRSVRDLGELFSQVFDLGDPLEPILPGNRRGQAGG
jgi:hypothetical protein